MSKLTVSTPEPNEIHMTRVFHAPRRLVIQAMTTPDLIKRWLGGGHTTVVSAEVDLRVGGGYRYLFRTPDGREFGMSGVFREISDGRIVQTEMYNDAPDAAEVITTYVESGGRTTMTIVMRFASQAVRDMVLETGMADGAGQSYDHLDALLAEQALAPRA